MRSLCEIRAREKVLGLVLASAGLLSPATAAEPALRAWTLDEARAELALQPDLPYLQFVALQLARGAGKEGEVAQFIDQGQGGGGRNGRREQVDLFSLFTGALAVQESLQLDTMRFGPREDVKKKGAPSVKVAGLAGPTIQSHPWKKMLQGKKPEVSELSRCVPEDFYLAEFRSLNKLLDATEAGDLWGTHLFNQALREARTQNIGTRLREQLALYTSPLLRPVYDLVVEEVALTGSDLYLREGSDVTLLFKVKQPELFKARLDGFLAQAQREHPEATRAAGVYQGIAYEQLATPGRELSVFSAYPREGLHVRSNCKAAFERVLDAVLGQHPDKSSAPRLGESGEFAYIRSLMPRGAPEEDGFVYLSDPFIRNLVGPRTKLTEQRRMICYNHLRMLGHAALLYRTQFGRPPASLEDLAKAKCAPGIFGQNALACSDGGSYALSPDGSAGRCSHHGHATAMTPCLEIPVAAVSASEAEAYKAFLEQYNRYWRTYFDPIALRLKMDARQYRLETLILPLLDNSIYTGMALALGGASGKLEMGPVPKRNIFSMAVRFNRDELLKHFGEYSWILAPKPALPASLSRLSWEEFISRGIDSSIGLHVYDAAPTFDLNLPSLLGEALSSMNGTWWRREETLIWSFLAASLNAPVYGAMPVKDPKIVDDFLNHLDLALAQLARQKERNGWFPVDQDFYLLEGKGGGKIRGYVLRFGPVKWRFFWARIGAGLYIASKKEILDDLEALEAERARAAVPAAGKAAEEPAPEAHALVRVRPLHWDKVLPDYRLSWAEHHREACLNNLGPLTCVARAFLPPATPEETERVSRSIQQEAGRLYAVHFFCPEGGQYVLEPDGRGMACSEHGSTRAPRQPAAPDENRALGKLMDSFAGLSAALTFTEDGLKAVVTLERK